MVTGLGQLPLAIIIIPAFNEESTIVKTIETLDRKLAELEKQLEIRFQIVLVEDGSTDRTLQIAKRVECNRLKIVPHGANRGLGAAVRTGIAAARKLGAEFMVKMDADLQHDPNDLSEMLAPLLRGDVDIVYGNRRARIAYKMPFVRKVGNRVFSGLLRYLTGWPVKDSQPGIFALNRRCMRKVRLPGDYNYTQQVLLSANLAGMRFEHVDVVFNKRAGGASFISLKYPFKVLPQILMVIMGAKPMKVFGFLGGVFLFLGISVFAIELILWLLGEGRKIVEHVNLVTGAILFGFQSLLFGLVGQMLVDQNKFLLDQLDPEDAIDDLELK